VASTNCRALVLGFETCAARVSFYQDESVKVMKWDNVLNPPG
jgi:hypothetical protein